MLRLIIIGAALADLERVVDVLRERQSQHAGATLPLVMDGLRILQAHPDAGRPADNGMRELMISRGRTGYVALYVFDEISDEVRVLGVRHQREAGYGLAP